MLPGAQSVPGSYPCVLNHIRLDTIPEASVEAICQSRVDLTLALLKSGEANNFAKAFDINTATLVIAVQSFEAAHIRTIKIRNIMGKEFFQLGQFGDASRMFEANVEELQADKLALTQLLSAAKRQRWLKDSRAALLCCANVMGKVASKPKIGEENKLEQETRLEARKLAASVQGPGTRELLDTKRSSATQCKSPRNIIQTEKEKSVSTTHIRSATNNEIQPTTEKKSPDDQCKRGSQLPRRRDSMELLSPSAKNVNSQGRARSASTSAVSPVATASIPRKEKEMQKSWPEVTNDTKSTKRDGKALPTGSESRQGSIPMLKEILKAIPLPDTMKDFGGTRKLPPKPDDCNAHLAPSEHTTEPGVPSKIIPLIRVGTLESTETERPVPEEWSREGLKRSRSTIHEKQAKALESGVPNPMQRRASSAMPTARNTQVHQSLSR